MKVQIGKYPKHRWYHNWLYDWFDYSPEQKINVRIDPWDTWSMDCTLAHIVVPMLKQLKKTKHGAPSVDDYDVPESLASTSAPTFNGENGEIDDNHFKRWDYVLDEMIWAFEQKIANDWQAQYYTFGKSGAKSDSIFEFEILDCDRTGMERHQERITNGLRLFGKYYDGLWD